MVEGPLESSEIGRSKPLLAAPFDEEQPSGELFTEFLDDGRRSVRRTVVDDQDVVFSFEGEHFADDSLDVFLLVIGWNDNDFAVHILNIISSFPLLQFQAACLHLAEGMPDRFRL